MASPVNNGPSDQRDSANLNGPSNLQQLQTPSGLPRCNLPPFECPGSLPGNNCLPQEMMCTPCPQFQSSPQCGSTIGCQPYQAMCPSGPPQIMCPPCPPSVVCPPPQGSIICPPTRPIIFPPPNRTVICFPGPQVGPQPPCPLFPKDPCPPCPKPPGITDPILPPVPPGTVDPTVPPTYPPGTVDPTVPPTYPPGTVDPTVPPTYPPGTITYPPGKDPTVPPVTKDPKEPNKTVTIVCPPKVPLHPKNTNIVRPVLVNIQRLLNFGIQVMLKNRHDQYTKIIISIEKIKKNPDQGTVVPARELVETYSRLIPGLKLLWEQLRDYYRNLLRDCNDVKNPIPSLAGLNISPMVSQSAFRDLLAATLVLCREALYLCSVDTNTTSQFIVFTDSQLMNNPRAIIEYCKVEIFESNFSKGDDLLRLFTEKQLLINLFLKEWAKGGQELDQPPAPSIYTTLPVSFPGLTADVPQKGYTKMGGGNVEDIVSRFNEIEDGAYRDVNKYRGQREDLNRSLSAVQRQ
ncbi:uncharacterized protein LOC128990167 [Macrosteles quadrilineatus]|uniref:uncharacterized protein LOC128990167 n=1 Tax=Macrosteles quadrilineatus TaxID=74068 RepID=UPI0023E1D8C8|nr:uncharacterized protein LOC128990167 [Macrosteles quadrilineatus]